MNRINLALIVMSVLLFISGAHIFTTNDGYYENDYAYHVKAEQVQTSVNTTDAVALEDLSENEQELLFRAFKKTDHFLGGASATIVYEDRQDNMTLNEWQVVNIDGVPMLVAISGPTVMEDKHQTGWEFVLQLIGFVLFFLGLMLFMMSMA